MPGRIRSIKPEFFTSPDTGRASLRARLFYVALWCWADDYGIGETNFNMLAGFAFPEEDQIERKELPSLCKEVADAYGTMFYTVRGRHYYSIPTWDEHQRTQRKAAAKYPTPDHPEAAPDLRVYGETGPYAPTQGTSAPTQGTSASTQGSDGDGTGEQGNRGTGEQGTCDPADAGSSSDAASGADTTTNPDAEALSHYLADRIRANGNNVRTVGKRWHDAMDRLIRIDGYTPEQIRQVIDWSQTNEFWAPNILSAPKLREKFDTLKGQMFNERNRQASRPQTAADRRLQVGAERHLRLADYQTTSHDPFDTYVRTKEIEA